MITLRADNSTLIDGAKYSYLVENYPSGSSVFDIANTDGFSVGSIIIIGDIGDERSELFRVLSVDTGSQSITVGATDGNPDTTAFSHAESSKIWVIPYDTIRFYWTSASGTIADENPTFDTSTPLTDYAQIDPSALFTQYSDYEHSTGFGWFVFRNSISEEASQESNPMPYAGFSANTISDIFDSFDSMLGVNQLDLVTMSDRFRWANEAISLIKTKLNLTTMAYTASDKQALSIVSGTSEYILDSDFSDLISITSNEGLPIGRIDIHEIDSYDSQKTKYYVRGRYIGFVPTPSDSTTYYYRYRAKSSKINNLSTYIDLPDNAFYAISDWMMYRASQKFRDRVAATDYLNQFTESVKLSMQSAVKQDADNDSWGIASYANV